MDRATGRAEVQQGFFPLGGFVPGFGVGDSVFDQALRETLRQQRLEWLELPERCIQFNTGTVGWLSFHLACGTFLEGK